MPLLATQVYMPKDVAEKAGGREMTKTGASLLVRGELTETPAEVKQPVELRATEVLHYGPCDPKSYPMSKKKHGMDFLREKAHLRPRTNVIGAVARVRSQLAHATHLFFQQHGFLYVHTPIITASDCEGAGEMYQVRACSQGLWLRASSTRWHQPAVGFSGCARANGRTAASNSWQLHTQMQVSWC